MLKHEEIAEALIRDILIGQYRTGERLPSERDLAARFEANRGAVREAMKKLEQLGIAEIQPGGARVCPLHEASLDVIGSLLEIGEIPDRQLVDQILVVISSLVQTAAQDTVRRASDRELESLRALVQPLCSSALSAEEHMQAHIQMMHAIMTGSGNLPVQLIARTLFLQFGPKLARLEGLGAVNLEARRALARQLDDALAKRNLARIREIFAELAELTREQVRSAFAAYDRLRTRTAREVAAS